MRNVEVDYLAAIVESSDEAIISRTLAGIVTSWNSAAAGLFGYRPEEIVGQVVSVLLPPDRLNEEEHILERILRGERIKHFETRRRHKDGHDILVSLTISPIRDPTGKIIGASIIARDITERNITAEAALQKSEDRLRRVIEAMPNGLVTIRGTGHIEMVNAEAERMFGYSRDELLGRPIETLAPDRHRRHVPELRDSIFANPQSRPMGAGRDFYGRRKDGSEFPVEVLLNPIETDEGTMILCVMVDVSARKRLEERLHQAQKMEAIGKLTGGIAHDFNNLLAIISGNLQLIKERGAHDPELDELAADAIQAAGNGARLTHQLLAYSRRQPLDPKVVNISSFIEDATRLLRLALGETIEIKQTIPTDLWTTRIDPHQLQNALLNLAVNARDAMPEGGLLIIEAANKILDEDYAEQHVEVTPGAYVQLAITDTGTGMPPEVATRALEPYFTTKAVGKGSGLGLSMVYGFVKQSGGHIKIYSEVGCGTAVRLYLPKAPNLPMAPSSIDERALTKGGKAIPASKANEVILLVEDDPMVRKLVVRVLTGLGYRVVEAEDGLVAMQILKEAGRIDLLLTDIVLPKGVSGPALARQAQKERAGLKVLYTSGYSKEAIGENGLVGEAAPLISKPFLKAELARMLRKVLDQGKDKRIPHAWSNRRQT